MREMTVSEIPFRLLSGCFQNAHSLISTCGGGKGESAVCCAFWQNSEVNAFSQSRLHRDSEKKQRLV